MRTRRNWFIAGVAAVCFVTGVALSHLIERGVHVQKVMLAEKTKRRLRLSSFPQAPARFASLLAADGNTRMELFHSLFV